MKRPASIAARVRAAVMAVFLAPLRFYSRFISPALPARCRYYPTCSAYAEQAVRELGVVRGAIVAAWRLVRCNPLSRGGYDPLEARSLFRPRDPHLHGPASGRSAT